MFNLIISIYANNFKLKMSAKISSLMLINISNKYVLDRALNYHTWEFENSFYCLEYYQSLIFQMYEQRKRLERCEYHRHSYSLMIAIQVLLSNGLSN